MTAPGGLARTRSASHQSSAENCAQGSRKIPLLAQHWHSYSEVVTVVTQVHYAQMDPPPAEQANAPRTVCCSAHSPLAFRRRGPLSICSTHLNILCITSWSCKSLSVQPHKGCRTVQTDWDSCTNLTKGWADESISTDSIGVAYALNKATSLSRALYLATVYGSVHSAVPHAHAVVPYFVWLCNTQEAKYTALRHANIVLRFTAHTSTAI
jgi:hypothetical protein